MTDVDSSPVEQFADELAGRWRAGGRPLAEEYISQLPPDDPDVALDLIAEELVLRQEYASPTTADELAVRFPQWSAVVRALFDCHQALAVPVGATFPEVGETLGDFSLLGELGRGANGRVFLAAQPELADRPVVLKVAPLGGGEHLTLARLQHTHVVPLYSAHEFPDRGLRAICLPHFGGRTIAAVIEACPKDGAELAAAIQPTPGPTVRFLESATLPEAVAWIGACLADALQYAHDRGVLHLDLKPSNVLLAADGTPMLLDFHLARPPLAAGDPPPAWLGGTPGAMPPEQEAALTAVRTGKPLPIAVDGRADVFALGVLLGQLLAPVAAPVGLSDILACCTATSPADRYRTAGEVAADLRRELADLPLRGVANRSPGECWRKWRRRRPLALPMLLAFAAALAAAGGVGVYLSRTMDRAEAAAQDAFDLLALGKFAESAEAARRGEAVAAGTPFTGELRGRLADLRKRADRGRVAANLHAACERVRPLYANDALTPEQVRTGTNVCRELWDQRNDFARTLAGQPTDALERQWRTDLLDLGILTAHLTARADRHRAVEILAEADALLGPSGATLRERAALGVAVGVPPPPATAWEYLASGRGRLAGGDLDGAAADLDRAVAFEPRSVWANYFRGVCHLRAGHPTEAVAAFAACVALAPDQGWCRYNRGLAYRAAGRADAAAADFADAVKLDPGITVPAR